MPCFVEITGQQQFRSTQVLFDAAGCLGGPNDLFLYVRSNAQNAASCGRCCCEAPDGVHFADAAQLFKSPVTAIS